MICETCGYTRMTKLGQSTKIHRQHLGKTINDKFHKMFKNSYISDTNAVHYN